MNTNSSSVGLAGTILILVVAFFAFLSAVFWYTMLAGQDDVIRWGAVAGSVAFSFAGPACAYLAPGRSKGLYLAAFIMMAGDCVQNGMGYQSLGQLAGGITEKQAAYDAAQSALVALPTPDAEGAIRQMSTYEATRDALKENVSLAKDELDTASEGQWPVEYVLAGFALLQIALLLAFRGLGKGKRPEPQAPAQAAPVRTERPNLHIVRRPEMSKQDQRAWRKIASA